VSIPVVNIRTDKRVQVTGRVDTNAPFVQFAATMLLNFLGKSTCGNAVLVLCRTIREVYSTLRHIIKTGLQLLSAHPRLAALLWQFDTIGDDFPELIDVTLSASRRVGQEPEQWLRGERRQAWRCLHLGVACDWRGIEEQYSAGLFTRFQAAAVGFVVSTPKLNVGVNVPNGAVFGSGRR
jgi:hypothetical protein